MNGHDNVRMKFRRNYRESYPSVTLGSVNTNDGGVPFVECSAVYCGQHTVHDN